MIVWIAIGVVFGALLCVGAFAWDWFGIRSMIEQDIRDAYRDAGTDRTWEILSRRREDDWPVLDRLDTDVWAAFSNPPEEDIDPWEAFSDRTDDKKGR